MSDTIQIRDALPADQDDWHRLWANGLTRQRPQSSAHTAQEN
jgi:hypothetical protein